MYRHTQQVLAVMALATAVVAVPQRGRAQALPASGTTASVARALELEARAERLYAEKNGWGKAARLMERAAALRPAGDAVAPGDLIVAGSVYYYAGKPALAVQRYVQAGERALADGNVTLAARAFQMGAIVANQRNPAVALNLKARAERLASSPGLTEAERRLILGQLRTPAVVAATRQ